MMNSLDYNKEIISNISTYFENEKTKTLNFSSIVASPNPLGVSKDPKRLEIEKSSARLKLDKYLNNIKDNIIKKESMAELTSEILNDERLITLIEDNIKSSFNQHSSVASYDLHGWCDELTNSIQNQQNLWNNCRHMEMIIQSFIDFSLIETSNFSLNLQSINIPATIKEIVDTYEFQIKGKHLQVELNIDKDAKGLFDFYTDRERFRIIISSIYHNAIKFSKRSKIAIYVG